jgi:predicted nucleotidyltransferase component of viral defense system
MNTAARQAQYEERGFSRETAVINVLLEETLNILFSRFPETFVFFGGASLVLFYGSPRHSGDLDLLTSADTPPSAADLEAVLRRPLSEVAETLGFGELTIEPAREGAEFLKLAVRSAGRALFTIDITRMSAVVKSELVAFPVSSEQTAVAVPSRNLQLLFKAEAFLTRSSLKARDAFDIKLLMDSGAALGANLQAHLADGPAADRLEDPKFIADRINRVDSRTCRPELQPYLPKEIYRELEQEEFKSLRKALTELFSEWL